MAGQQQRSQHLCSINKQTEASILTQNAAPLRLIDNLETLVEPILEYRHRGILVDPSPPLGKDSLQASFEGSSVVFVDSSDATPEDDSLYEGKETCFKLLAGKLAAVEDAKLCRDVLQKVQAMLEQAEGVCSSSGARAKDARKRIPQVFDKVNGLIDLVRQQQSEILELKSALAAVRAPILALAVSAHSVSLPALLCQEFPLSARVILLFAVHSVLMP